MNILNVFNIKSIIIVALATVVGIGAYIITGKKDSAVEQAAELVIKQETGLDIDLTPEKTNF